MRHFDSIHEEMAASSLREARQVTARWQADPDRWRQPANQWPDLLIETPGSGHYVASPFLGMAVEMWPAELLDQQRVFSREFLTVLDRLHEVWLKDGDPRALQVTVTTEPVAGISLGAPMHCEAGAPMVEVLTTTGHDELMDRYGPGQLRQLQAVWRKIAVMVDLVADHLMRVRELTAIEKHSISTTHWLPGEMERRIGLLGEHGAVSQGALRARLHPGRFGPDTVPVPYPELYQPAHSGVGTAHPTR